jgi:hypothetical protein
MSTTLRQIIASILRAAPNTYAAVEELARALEDEIEARVQDRVADLREQLERHSR